MKKSLLLLLIIFGLSVCSVHAQKNLFFRNGKFRILQFTDLHWDPTSENSSKTRSTMESLMKKEQPDFVILTGDVVTEQPAEDGWESIISIFEDAKMPFSVVMGNHDPEKINKNQLFDRLLQSPYFIGEKGPSDIKGVGNFTIPIYSTDDFNKVEAVLYCIDSNDYAFSNEYGYYDWIHFNQIEWYRKKSAYYTQENQGKTIPSLVFVHIPIMEFKNVAKKPTTLGVYNEHGTGSSRINSGLLASFIEKGDVIGLFAGHDHSNDFIGVEYGVALGYGRVTGTDAYGDLERGGRVIELYEGKSQFDTYISTPTKREHTFYYPSQLSSKDEMEMEYLSAKNINPNKNGVNFTYYEGEFQETKDITSGKKVKTGTLNNFSIDEAQQEDHFGFDFRTYIKIPKKGVYRFYTFTDDGSRLYIDGKEIVNNDGGHSERKAEGKVALEKGFHELRVLYFEDYMGQAIKVGYSSRDIRETTIPDEVLFLSK